MGLLLLGLWFVSLVYLFLACGSCHWSACPWPVVHINLLVSGFADQENDMNHRPRTGRPMTLTTTVVFSKCQEIRLTVAALVHAENAVPATVKLR